MCGDFFWNSSVPIFDLHQESPGSLMIVSKRVSWTTETLDAICCPQTFGERYLTVRIKQEKCQKQFQPCVVNNTSILQAGHDWMNNFCAGSGQPDLNFARTKMVIMDRFLLLSYWRLVKLLWPTCWGRGRKKHSSGCLIMGHFASQNLRLNFVLCISFPGRITLSVWNQKEE